jgi:hypothetical protein
MEISVFLAVRILDFWFGPGDDLRASQVVSVWLSLSVWFYLFEMGIEVVVLLCRMFKIKFIFLSKLLLC